MEGERIGVDHQREPGSAAQGKSSHQGLGINGMVAANQIHVKGYWLTIFTNSTMSSLCRK